MFLKKYFFLFLILCTSTVFAASNTGASLPPQNSSPGTSMSEQQQASQLDAILNGNNGSTRSTSSSLPAWAQNVAVSGQLNIDGAVSSNGQSQVNVN